MKKKARIVVEYNGMLFKQPNCRVKIDENGGIACLVRFVGKWQPVKGRLIEFEFISDLLLNQEEIGVPSISKYIG